MTASFNDPLTRRIADFISSIGLQVHKAELPEDTFLPGIRIFEGTLLVDEERLTYPGDLLHEAAHLAVMPAEVRTRLSDNVRESHPQGEGGEMESIAWSYAAAVELGIDPGIVFHAGGYRGHSNGLMFNFQIGCYVGIQPLLDAGMTGYPSNRPPETKELPPYPRMTRWLR